MLRLVEPGNAAACERCGHQIKFAAPTHPHQVIANVYEDGVWQRVAHFHAACYEEAGEPFGPVAEPDPRG